MHDGIQWAGWGELVKVECLAHVSANVRSAKLPPVTFLPRCSHLIEGASSILDWDLM
ncbi:MAG: hypothetical protein MK082_09485 [Phycisphaerales bacterium]|nr:hypothetical protein [Phycisphaerales bacterium]